MKTVRDRAVSKLDLKLKYIATLETLTEGFGCELFEPVSLRTSDTESQVQSSTLKQPTSYQVLVSAMVGIQWRLKPSEVRSESVNVFTCQRHWGPAAQWQPLLAALRNMIPCCLSTQGILD